MSKKKSVKKIIDHDKTELKIDMAQTMVVNYHGVNKVEEI